MYHYPYKGFIGRSESPTNDPTKILLVVGGNNGRKREQVYKCALIKLKTQVSGKIQDQRYICSSLNLAMILSMLFILAGVYQKTHGFRGFGNYYHMRFDPKLGHGICSICCITCACSKCTSIIDKPWVHGLTPQQQTLYQPVTYFN